MIICNVSSCSWSLRPRQTGKISLPYMSAGLPVGFELTFPSQHCSSCQVMSPLPKAWTVAATATQHRYRYCKPALWLRCLPHFRPSLLRHLQTLHLLHELEGRWKGTVRRRSSEKLRRRLFSNSHPCIVGPFALITAILAHCTDMTASSSSCTPTLRLSASSWPALSTHICDT